MCIQKLEESIYFDIICGILTIFHGQTLDIIFFIFSKWFHIHQTNDQIYIFAVRLMKMIKSKMAENAVRKTNLQRWISECPNGEWLLMVKCSHNKIWPQKFIRQTESISKLKIAHIKADFRACWIRFSNINEHRVYEQ